MLKGLKGLVVVKGIVSASSSSDIVSRLLWWQQNIEYRGEKGPDDDGR
jgi:hypothetical protein